MSTDQVLTVIAVTLVSFGIGWLVIEIIALRLGEGLFFARRDRRWQSEARHLRDRVRDHEEEQTFS